ncbi:MAG: tRNA lysidine(34) synthetase TilS [Betaproteobacteria bacterium]
MTASAALLDRLRRRLAEVPLARRHVVVGLSGGVDSVVLLDSLGACAAHGGFTIGALHVHHGLSRNADAWSDFCSRLCRDRNVPLTIARVSVARHGGGGMEAAARAARYGAFRSLEADCVALAHNLDDQAETVLLQLLRGAGAEGLSGMPFVRPLGAGLLIRPLIDVPRRDIEDHARSRRLDWIEDESNVDVARARNLLRVEVLPRLESHYPGYRDALARAARNAADAAALMDAVAIEDLATIADDGGLDVVGLAALGTTRAANALRKWLRDAGLTMPPRVRLQEALRQLTDAAPDAAPEVVLGASVLRRYRDRIRIVPRENAAAHWCVAWQGEACMILPDGRRIWAQEGVGEGIASARLRGARVLVRNRRGGERFRVASDRPHRELKNLFQEHGVAPWERGRLPLLCVNDRVVWVPGLGVDPDFVAARAEPSIRFELEGLEALGAHAKLG